MATFGEIRTLVHQNIARDMSDTVASALVRAAINYAVLMASLMFEPPEMFIEEDVTVPISTSRLDLTTVAVPSLAERLIELIKLYNKTQGFKLSFIPYDQWDIIVPSDLATVKFWSSFGKYVYFKATLPAAKVITFSYRVYPEQLTDDGTDLPFEFYDSYVTATATGIVFACFEETDSAALWEKVGALVGMPSALSTKARSVIEGQKMLLESALAQNVGGGGNG